MNNGDDDSPVSPSGFVVALKGVEGGGASPLEVLARIGLKGDVSNARKTDVFDKLETGED